MRQTETVEKEMKDVKGIKYLGYAEFSNQLFQK